MLHLIRLLTHAEAEIRTLAAWTLGKLQPAIDPYGSQGDGAFALASGGTRISVDGCVRSPPALSGSPSDTLPPVRSTRSSGVWRIRSLPGSGTDLECTRRAEAARAQPSSGVVPKSTAPVVGSAPSRVSQQPTTPDGFLAERCEARSRAERPRAIAGRL